MLIVEIVFGFDPRCFGYRKEYAHADDMHRPEYVKQRCKGELKTGKEEMFSHTGLLLLLKPWGSVSRPRLYGPDVVEQVKGFVEELFLHARERKFQPYN